MSQSAVRLFLITVVGVFFSCTIFGQPLFQRLYSVGDSITSAYYISESSNGNVFISGTISRVNANYDGIVWMLSPDGTPVWTLKVSRGTASSLYLFEILATPDGGCIFLANYEFSNKYNNSIVKLSSTGAVEWVTKTAVTTYYQYTGIKKITGGYLITGSNPGTGSPIFKVDESGNYMWGNMMNGLYLYSSDALELSNGDILIAGGGKWMKFAADGQVLAYYDYRDTTAFGNYLGPFYNCFQEGDSLVFIGGNYLTKTLFAFKTDMKGNPGSTARIAGLQGLSIINIISDADNNFLLSCISGSVYQPIVVKISKDFDVLWAKTYLKGNNSEQLFFDMTPAATGGYWFTGDHLKNNKYIMYLARMDNDGAIPGACCPKSVETERLPCNVSKIDIGYTTTALPIMVEGTVLTSFTQTTVTPFCEQSQTISLSDTSICPGNCVDISLSGAQPGSQYNWIFPNAMPDSSSAVNPGKVCYHGSGDYKILLEQDGCLIDSAALKVDNATDLFPNAFSPNADGVNETFKPIVTCPVDEYHFDIFNRWGEMVFSTTDPETGWDGAINGNPAPIDVYVYRVQYFVLDGDVRRLVMNEMKEVSLVR